MNKPERIQLSLRFDHRKELLESVKARAKKLDVALVDFVAAALEKALEERLNPMASQRQDNDKIIALEARMEELERQLESGLGKLSAA
jgi:RNA polymerase-binding transcription factor DksA